MIDYNTELLSSGDVFIYYSNRWQMTFESSIRMETFLAGIEDYELLQQLMASNPDEAARLAKESNSSFTDYVWDPAAFRKIESDILAATSRP